MLATDGIDLLGKYKVLPSQPMAAMNNPGADAYAARVTKGRNKDSTVFAYVLNSMLPPRMDVAGPLRALDSFGILQVVDWGAIEWPSGGRRMCLIHERPNGRRLFRAMKDTREAMSEEMVVKNVMTPIAEVLRYTTSRGLVHGKIRPTNIFWREPTSTTAALGESVCSPPGYGQPMVFEGIERSMATPAGRGSGSPTDDLYAFGVTLLMLIFGRNPVAHLRDDQILQAKMDRGSYSGLVGDLRVPLNLIEPLRGLLIDDARQRWTMEEMEMWLSGRRLSPKQAQVPKRASRPFEIGGKVCWDLRNLALALTRNPTQGAQMIESGDVDRWLRRSMSDDIKAEQVEAAVEAAVSVGKGGTTEDRMIARAAIVLDPHAPIRFKGFGMMPDGVGSLLAQVMVEQKPVQPMAELIMAQLGPAWLSAQPDPRIEFAQIVQQFEGAKVYLDKPLPGLGIERVLYDLNPGMACISSLVDSYYCLDPQDVLMALDRVADRPDRPKEPFDRHIAAFLMSRAKRLDDRTMGLISSGDPSRRYLAMLAILGEVQSRHGPTSVPNLAAWMCDLLDPIISRYRNAYFREELKAEALRVASKGDLQRVAALIDDPKALARDDSDFAGAQKDFSNIQEEIEELRYEIEDDPSSSVDLGQQAAAVISSVAAMAAVFVALFVMVM
jgi:eukaryotic-like serine/threonine-protein kinase